MHKELCNRLKNHIFPIIPEFNLKRLLDEVLHDSEEVDSFNELFSLALKRKPILLLILICPYIDTSTLRIPLSIESPDYDDFSSKYTLVFTSDIDEYSKILDVKLNDYGVPIEEENPAESYLESHISAGENIEINLLGFNGFNCSVNPNFHWLYHWWSAYIVLC
jgi:hypothetical protein